MSTKPAIRGLHCAGRAEVSGIDASHRLIGRCAGPGGPFRLPASM
jgi:hypothetical protein